MRAVSTLKGFSYFKFPTTKMGFSECARGNGSIPKVYEDWQYCKMITNELKNNNLNQSLSLLFQSYLNNQILDIQIYNQIHEKIVQAKVQLSYAEIVYQIYRQHFPPHPLMTSWMHKLTYSKNEKLIEKLKKDYEALGLVFPMRSPRAMKRQAKKEMKVQKVEQNPVKQSSYTPRRSKLNKKSALQAVPLPNIELPNTVAPHNEQLVAHNQQIQSKISSQIRDALNQLSSDINSFSRIVVHDIQITVNNSTENDNSASQSISEQQEQQEQSDEQVHMGLYGLDISQIKIGRVQFIGDKLKDE